MSTSRRYRALLLPHVSPPINNFLGIHGTRWFFTDLSTPLRHKYNQQNTAHTVSARETVTTYCAHTARTTRDQKIPKNLSTAVILDEVGR